MASPGLLLRRNGLHAHVHGCTSVRMLLGACRQVHVAPRLHRHHHSHRDVILSSSILRLHVPPLLAQRLSGHHHCCRYAPACLLAKAELQACMHCLGFFWRDVYLAIITVAADCCSSLCSPRTHLQMVQDKHQDHAGHPSFSRLLQSFAFLAFGAMVDHEKPLSEEDQGHKGHSSQAHSLKRCQSHVIAGLSTVCVTLSARFQQEAWRPFRAGLFSVVGGWGFIPITHGWFIGHEHLPIKHMLLLDVIMGLTYLVSHLSAGTVFLEAMSTCLLNTCPCSMSSWACRIWSVLVCFCCFLRASAPSMSLSFSCCRSDVYQFSCCSICDAKICPSQFVEYVPEGSIKP